MESGDIMNKKWKFIRKLFLCKCALVFRKRTDFIQHLRDTKRWRNYHYAPDNKEVKFILFEVQVKK